MDNRDDALIVVGEWLEKGIPPVSPAKGCRELGKEQPKPEAPPRPVAVELSNAQLLSELRKAALTSQDVLKIEKILREKGLVTLIVQKDTPGAELLEDYLTRFWDYERSPYVEEKLSHKIKIGRTHTKLSLERIKMYWIPYFKGKALGEISRQGIKNFSNALAKNYPDLSPLTLRQILLVGVTALRWAYANDLIPEDLTKGLPSYSTKSRKRGVLTPQEATALFKLAWKDKRAMLVNLVAMTTGLRIAEILALHLEDVGEEYLTIQWSYSIVDGLKSTKTDDPRILPVIPQIRDALRQHGATNPHGDGFVFYGEKPNKPWDQHQPLKVLKKMLVRLKVGTDADTNAIKETEEYWKKRNVVFHSWRHFYSSRMADKLEARKVMLATGHKTEAVFRAYSDHALESDLNEVAVTTSEVFGGMLPEKMEMVEPAP
jgi:integrase